MSEEHKRNAKIISEAIAQLEKDPEGMALAFANIYLHSKPKKETPVTDKILAIIGGGHPDWIIAPLDEIERIAKENGIDVKDLNLSPIKWPLEEEK